MGKLRTTFTMEDEIEYIKRIKSFDSYSTRLDKLKMYKITLSRRKDWADIDPKQIMDFLDSEIIKEHNSTVALEMLNTWEELNGHNLVSKTNEEPRTIDGHVVWVEKENTKVNITIKKEPVFDNNDFID